MSSSLQYKFKSQLKYKAIHFDGESISLNELRERIMSEKKMQKTNNLVLEITNTNTNEVYSSPDNMIPRNSLVTVKRVPVQRLPAVKSELSKEEEELTEMAFSKLSKTADLARATASESDKISAMMKQSNVDFDSSLYTKLMPSTYTCFRCGVKGHFIKNCPTLGDTRYDNQSPQNKLRNAGIPREILNIRIQQEELLIAKLRAQQKSLHFAPVVGSDVVSDRIPADLQCSICNGLFEDSVITACCGVSYCDKCIRNYLIEHECICPSCKIQLSPDNLIENKSVRAAVINFRNRKTVLSAVASSTKEDSSEHTGLHPQHATSSQVSVCSTALSDPSVTSTQETAHENSENLVSTTTPSAEIDFVSEEIAPEKSVVSDSVQGSTIIVQTSAETIKLATSLASTSAFDPGIDSTETSTVTSTLAHTVPIPTVKIASSSVMFPSPAIITCTAPMAVATGVTPVVAAHSLQQQQIIQHQAQQIQFLQQQHQQISQHLMSSSHPQPSIIRVANPPGVHIPPGHQLIKRLVPVPVGPPQRMPTSHPQLVDTTSVIPQKRGKWEESDGDNERNITADIDSPSMPMSKEEFYIWQRTVLEHSQRTNEVIDLRDTSPVKSRSSRRIRSRSHDRHTDHANQKEKKLKEKLNEKSKQRPLHEPSRSGNGESDIASDCLENKIKRKQKLAALQDYRNKRHIPERIKRELDEFEFDNELEFDEELRRLKSKDKERKKKRKRLKDTSSSKKSGESDFSEDEEILVHKVHGKSHTIKPRSSNGPENLLCLKNSNTTDDTNCTLRSKYHTKRKRHSKNSTSLKSSDANTSSSSSESDAHEHDSTELNKDHTKSDTYLGEKHQKHSSTRRPKRKSVNKDDVLPEKIEHHTENITVPSDVDVKKLENAVQLLVNAIDDPKCESSELTQEKGIDNALLPKAQIDTENSNSLTPSNIQSKLPLCSSIILPENSRWETGIVPIAVVHIESVSPLPRATRGGSKSSLYPNGSSNNTGKINDFSSSKIIKNSQSVSTHSVLEHTAVFDAHKLTELQQYPSNQDIAQHTKEDKCHIPQEAKNEKEFEKVTIADSIPFSQLVYSNLGVSKGHTTIDSPQSVVSVNHTKPEKENLTTRSSECFLEQRNYDVEDERLSSTNLQDIENDEITDTDKKHSIKKARLKMSSCLSDSDEELPKKKLRTDKGDRLKSKLANVRNKITIEEKLIKLASKSNSGNSFSSVSKNLPKDNNVDGKRPSVESKKKVALAKIKSKRVKEGKDLLSPEQEMRIQKLLEERIRRKSDEATILKSDESMSYHIQSPNKKEKVDTHSQYKHTRRSKKVARDKNENIRNPDQFASIIRKPDQKFYKSGTSLTNLKSISEHSKRMLNNSLTDFEETGNNSSDVVRPKVTDTIEMKSSTRRVVKYTDENFEVLNSDLQSVTGRNLESDDKSDLKQRNDTFKSQEVTRQEKEFEANESSAKKKERNVKCQSSKKELKDNNVPNDTRVVLSSGEDSKKSDRKVTEMKRIVIVDSEKSADELNKTSENDIEDSDSEKDDHVRNKKKRKKAKHKKRKKSEDAESDKKWKKKKSKHKKSKKKKKKRTKKKKSKKKKLKCDPDSSSANSGNNGNCSSDDQAKEDSADYSSSSSSSLNEQNGEEEEEKEDNSEAKIEAKPFQRRSLSEEPQIELDYDEDLASVDDGIDFADDEQVHISSAVKDESVLKEFEEGEIADCASATIIDKHTIDFTTTKCEGTVRELTPEILMQFDDVVAGDVEEVSRGFTEDVPASHSSETTGLEFDLHPVTDDSLPNGRHTGSTET